MVDLIIGSTIACLSMYIASTYQPKEVRKINNVFKNVNYRVGKLVPRRIKTRRKDGYTEYVYEVPPGLVDDPKLSEILTKTLRKPVEIKFRGVLIIRVYNTALTTEIKYDWEPSKDWSLPIGYTLDGVLRHDFDRVPHMTVAGATRQGKTVLLKLILAHLINSQPNNAEIYILDLKGGIEFGKYRNLRQVKEIADSVKSAEKVLGTIVRRMKNDMKRYSSGGFSNTGESGDRRRVFIITDEAAELADSKRCLNHLSEICRLGGALGYRNIFCTQYPTADTLPRQVKQNSDARISFRLPTEVASRVAIDEGGAEKLSNPGRAIYRTHERFEIQVPLASDSEICEKLADQFIEKGGEDIAEEIEEKDSTTGENIIDISGFNLRNRSTD